MHVRSKDNEEVVVNNREKLIVMLCDGKAKKERIKCIADYKNENTKIKGNIGIKCGNISYEKSISEVIRNIDSRKNSIEHVQHKYDQHWEEICIYARDSFSTYTASKIKCAAGINTYGERTK